jgi:hypothetical protein
MHIKRDNEARSLVYIMTYLWNIAAMISEKNLTQGDGEHVHKIGVKAKVIKDRRKRARKVAVAAQFFR